jgi:LysM repeat protein/lipoprotein-anchoring transpeptidase ErfK/SrfK
MLSACLRLFALMIVWEIPFAFAQMPAPPEVPVKRLGRNVEPGLEAAVKWKWQVLPSAGAAWGQTPPGLASQRVVAAETAPTPMITPTPPPSQTYEVKSGDRLIFIAKRFGITVVQLKGFNNLTTDMIKVGQILNIPSLEQAKAIAPMPEEKKPAATKGQASAAPTPNQTETLALQIFLDREGFSGGPINGKTSTLLEKVAQLYRDSHADVQDPEALRRKALAASSEVFTRYTLRADDFHFIVPPKAQHPDTSDHAKPAAGSNAVGYQDLISAPLLAYRTPWEFVAERFHCEESFLRSINDQISTAPQVGTEFRVPNVVPFAIESALIEPLQPKADSQRPMTAVIEDLSLLKISEDGALVAVMPVSAARPGLRGRGTWTILNAIARPCLSTQQEPTASATPAPPLFGSSPSPTPSPTPLPATQYLAAGPNNPAGIIWINLAKSGSAEPLPYGLHGTSIPDQMKLLDSIGGFRLANWNIARAVHLLPEGTPLAWEQTAPLAPAPAVAQPASQPMVPAPLIQPTAPATSATPDLPASLAPAETPLPSPSP